MDRSPVSPVSPTSTHFSAQNGPSNSYTAIPPSSPRASTSSRRPTPSPVATANSTAPNHANPLTRWERYTQLAFDLWLWEIASIWVSCICLGGIFLTLGLHNNQPLPDWPFDITINSMISVLSTIMKSAVMVPVASAISQSGWHWFKEAHPLSDVEIYNEASRGPWGSAVMLTTIQWRNIASLGALITILMMAVDPFVQQVAVYEPDFVVSGNSSIIPSRRLYDAGLDNIDAHPQLGPPMKAAIYQGLYFTAESNDSFAMSALAPRPACPSGNCTFPEFETLAVCSKCADITDKLHREWTNDSTTSQAAYNWSLPNGFSTGDIPMSDRAHVIMKTSASHNSTVLTAGLPLLNYSAIYIPDGYDVAQAEGPDFPIPATAQECMLHWCVKKYRSAVVNGLLNETVLETTSEGGDDMGHLYHFQPKGSNASFEIPPFEAPGTMFNASGFGPYPYGTTLKGTFLVNKNASNLATQFFKDSFEGEVTANGDTTGDGHSTSTVVQRFYVGGLAAVFDNIAMSMSTTVRGKGSDTKNTGAGADNVTITGYSTTMVTYIRVRWWWLTLPVVLELATICLLGVTVWNSRRKRVWKSSALATMLHGVNEHDVRGEKVERYVDMERVAKEKRVALGSVDERQRLQTWNGIKT